MRVAVVDQATGTWSGGGVFTETVVRALRCAGLGEQDVMVFVGTASSRWRGIATQVPPPRLFKGEGIARQYGRLPSIFERYCDRHRVTALLCPMYVSPWPTRCKRVVWVPDFQHEYLTGLYPTGEVASIRRRIAQAVGRTEAVLLSSNSALADYCRFYPHYAAKGKALQFPSLLSLVPPPATVTGAREAYHVPDKFLLVANQFWMHKNHHLLIKAIGLLMRRGLRVPVVATGLLADHRDPTSSHLSNVMQAIAGEGVHDCVRVLGLVPRSHLLDLMRTAAVVVQPSRFEGWSTVIQDAKALGRPVICSDIAVNREQMPDAIGFFGCDDAEALANIIEQAWSRLEPGPNYVCEREALARETEFAKRYAAWLVQLCRSQRV